MEPFVTELYTWNSWGLPVITFNYFVHFLLYFYWLINTWRGKGGLQELCAEMHSERQEWAQAEFCGPCEMIGSFCEIFTIYTRGHWLLWVLGHGQFSMAGKSGVSSIKHWAFYFERTSSSVAMSGYCSAHCVVLCLLDCESGKKYNNFNIIPWAVVYVIYSTPDSLRDYHRRNKTTKYPLISLDLFPRPWLKHISVMMGISWLITVLLKAQK